MGSSDNGHDSVPAPGQPLAIDSTNPLAEPMPDTVLDPPDPVRPDPLRPDMPEVPTPPS